MLRLRPRPILLAFALVAVASGLTVAQADTTLVPVAGINQAYHAGYVDDEGDVAPSVDAAHDGEWLSLAAQSVGRRSLEPTIGLDSQGHAYYAASWHDDSPSLVLPITEVRRSTDNGLTWENISPQVNGTELPPTNGDPYVFVDQDTDRLFNPEAAGACLYMNFSDDGGNTWLTNPVACGGLNVDHQSFEAGPFPAQFSSLRTIYQNVLWYCSNHVAQAQCSQSVDGGIVWKPSPAPAYPGFDSAAGGLCGGLSGHVEIDSEGRAFLPKGHCGNPWVSFSEDLGASWTRVKVSDLAADSTHIAAAIDADDNVYVVFWGTVDNPNTETDPRLPWLVYSTDHGTTWSEPIMVAPPGVQEVNFPEITAGDAGKIAIVFPGTTSTDPSDDRRPWNAYTVVSTNILDENPLFVSATGNGPDNPVHRGSCGPGRCLPMWDFIDVVTNPVDGHVWSTLSDGCEATSCFGAEGVLDNVSSGMGYSIIQVGGPVIRTVQAAPPQE